MLAHAFVVGEEEELILQDRSTHGSAKDLLRIGVLGGDRDRVVVVPRVAVETLVSQQVVKGAVEVVGPGLQDGDDSAAVGVSVCGIGICRDYAHLGNGIGRWIIADKVVLRLVVFGAFYRVVVLLSAIAVDRYLAVVEGIAFDGIVSSHSGRVGIDCAGLEKRER